MGDGMGGGDWKNDTELLKEAQYRIKQLEDENEKLLKKLQKYEPSKEQLEKRHLEEKHRREQYEVESTKRHEEELLALKECDMCGAPTEYIRLTQFAGDHPFCGKCAKLQKDFSKPWGDSYYFWKKIKNGKSCMIKHRHVNNGKRDSDDRDICKLCGCDLREEIHLRHGEEE